MGYTCPVCGDPQADGRHLADHLAVTAMVHGDDHEAWLDDHAPGWSEMTPADLGPVVAEHAAETDYPQVFEDTTGGHDHGHGGGVDDHARSDGAHDHDAGGRDAPSFEEHVAQSGRRGPAAGRGDMTADQRAIVEEARAMTEEMLDGDGDDAGDGDEGDDAGDGDDERERGDGPSGESGDG